MPIVVEDGTGTVAGANSYISIDEAKQYATDRGLVLSSTDDTVLSGMLFQAMDYLNGLDYIGVRLLDAQPLDWPRQAVRSSCGYVGYSRPLFPAGVPVALKNAQARLVYEVSNGVDLFPTTTGETDEMVVEETVGPLTTKYAKPASDIQLVDGKPILTAVQKLLKPLLSNSGFGGIRVYRG